MRAVSCDGTFFMLEGSVGGNKKRSDFERSDPRIDGIHTEAAKGATGVFSVQMGTHPGNKRQETLHANNLIAAAKTAGIEQIVHTLVAHSGEHEKNVGWE